MTPPFTTKFQSLPRRPHAWLIVAANAATLTRQAEVLATQLLCGQTHATKDDASCLICRKLRHRSHPDLFWLRPPGREIPISELKEAQRWLLLGPTEAQSKLLVIEEAEALSVYSGNALLKLLEEPPPHGHLALLTKDATLVLPTLRSRCVTLRVPAASTDEVSDVEETSEVVQRALEVFTASQESPRWAGLLDELAADKNLHASFFSKLFDTFRDRMLRATHADIATLTFLDALLQSQNAVTQWHAHAGLHLHHLYALRRHLWRTP